MPSSRKPVASAILAVYNGEKTISACLESLCHQSIPIEIICVDDGSTDGTNSSMIRIIELFPQAKIHIIKRSHQGPAIARNLGATRAQTDILLFVDADMVFGKDYVRDLVKPIQTGKSIGTYTTNEQVMNWDSDWARCWNWEEGWEDRKRFPQNPPKWGTDYRAILKSEFDRVGGFDHIGYTDTWSLYVKLEIRPLATEALCYHKNPDSLATVYRQARWAAKRPYKLGTLGALYALLRSAFPVSLIAGCYKAVLHRNASFLVFKFVYDWGRFVGILEMLLTGNLTK